VTVLADDNDRALMNPITGIDCLLRAETGHAAAAPPK
jgi:hypothetical protein